MEISDAEFSAANRRHAELLATYPTALSVRFDRRSARVVIALSSGIHLTFLPRDVQGFETARPEELAVAEISPSGLGVHFPIINADIYIPGLINGLLGSKRWMKSRNAMAHDKSLGASEPATVNGKRKVSLK